MSFRRRTTSESQLKLQSRMTALEPVEPDFDFGEGLDKQTLTAFVDSLQEKLAAYNNTLATADSLRDELKKLEKKADDISERLYAAIIARFGRDSEQYQRIGGVRKSEIDYSGSRPETFEGASAPTNGEGSTDSTGEEPGSDSQ